ncbi:YjcZ family sporulation protein [Paenibacillus rhizophilus]|nr:YjcZ family sporulation protein [Paenibacillus rhizophilus]
MGYGCVGGVGGEDKGPVYPMFTSTGTILVLYILLVIILKTCWI